MGSTVCKKSTLDYDDDGDGRAGGRVEEVFDDARLLADFVIYLQEVGDQEALSNIWQAELHWSLDSHSDASRTLIDRLQEAWQYYEKSQHHDKSFSETKQWASHDLPATDVAELIDGSSYRGVQEGDELYALALAVMIGIHVATICSDIIDGNLPLDKSKHAADEASHEELLVSCVRSYVVPVCGSAYSPRTILKEDFEFHEYAPQLFREMRRLSGVSEGDYIEALCRTDFTFIPFGSNSKSGELFFFSHDSKFFLKSCSEQEAKVLLDMLLALIARLDEEPRTLLGRYLGLYRLQLEGKSRLMMVMQAVGGGGLKIHKTYDLKGSTRNRLAKPREGVGKDLNFLKDVQQLSLEAGPAQQLAEVHRGDLELLAEYEIMDYSVLVRIHDRNPPLEEATSRSTRALTLVTPEADVMTLREGMHQERWYHRRKRGLRAQSLRDPRYSWAEGLGSKCGQYTYYMGIVDMLVPYTLYPKAQYVGTNLITCCHAHTSSRVPPAMYAERQQDFFGRIVGILPEESEWAPRG